MLRPAPPVPTIHRAPIRALMAGGWSGPVQAAGHALHYVAHPLMPPLLVSIGSPDNAAASQPPNDGALNYQRDTVRGFHRLAPGGTLVSRTPLQDVYIRVDRQDRSNGFDWEDPGLTPYLKRQHEDASGANSTWYDPCTVHVLGNELHGDDVVLISGEGDLFPRDVRPELPSHLVLPAFLARSGGSSVGVTDTVLQELGAPPINFARLTDSLPRAVWSRYRRVCLVLESRFESYAGASAPWLTDASLPVVQLPVRYLDPTGPTRQWLYFAFGGWSPDYRARCVINLGSPDEFAAACDDAGLGPVGDLSNPAANCPDAPTRRTVGRFVLDQGDPDAGEVEHASCFFSMDPAGLLNFQKSYWCALPTGRRNNRVGVTCDALPASTWYVQLARYLSLGWGLGDQLYTRALVTADYDSVLLGPGVAALSDVDATGPQVGGVAVGVTTPMPNTLAGCFAVSVGP